MNKSSGRVKTQAQAPLVTPMGDPRTGEEIKTGVPDSQIPPYLQSTYWWAYIHPKAVSFFEKQWVINLILWGNFVRLRDITLNELGSHIQGNTLQIACVYGDFSSKLAQRIAEGGMLDIVDAVPIQLDNVRAKIHPSAPVRTIQIDSSSLMFADESYDQVVLFFLLHEMPDGVRRRTLSEAVRVLKPGGKLVIVDFHKPSVLHPLRYLYPIIFRLLEPFAMDTWHQKIEDWLPGDFTPLSVAKETLFGSLYQKLVIQK
jgi:ubiquinone/menaquinone biosynthesis C-methylase UbiE